MKYINPLISNFCFLLICLTSSPLFSKIVNAQSFTPLSSGSVYNELRLSCIHFPDGSTQLGQYNPDTNDLALVGFEDPLPTINARISQNRTRMRKLNQLIRKLRRPKKVSIKRFLSIWEEVLEEKYNKKRKKKTIIRNSKRLVRILGNEIKDFEALKDLIKQCEDGTITPPTGQGMEILEFTFQHPDFDATYYMFGLGITVSLSNPNDSSGQLCVAADNPLSGAGGRFPFTRQRIFTKNPCSWDSKYLP